MNWVDKWINNTISRPIISRRKNGYSRLEMQLVKAFQQELVRKSHKPLKIKWPTLNKNSRAPKLKPDKKESTHTWRTSRWTLWSQWPAFTTLYISQKFTKWMNSSSRWDSTWPTWKCWPKSKSKCLKQSLKNSMANRIRTDMMLLSKFQLTTICLTLSPVFSPPLISHSVLETWWRVMLS